MRTDQNIKGLEWNDDGLMEMVARIAGEASREAAELVANTARELVPVDMGNLKESIEVKKSKFEDGGYVVVAQDKGSYEDTGYYATFVETGHLGMANGKRVEIRPQPFMRPAISKNKKKILKIFQNRFK